MSGNHNHTFHQKLHPVRFLLHDPKKSPPHGRQDSYHGRTSENLTESRHLPYLLILPAPHTRILLVYIHSVPDIRLPLSHSASYMHRLFQSLQSHFPAGQLPAVPSDLPSQHHNHFPDHCRTDTSRLPSFPLKHPLFQMKKG